MRLELPDWSFSADSLRRAIGTKTRANAAVPGNVFFEDNHGDDLLRFSYAKRGAELEEACRRLDAFAASR